MPATGNLPYANFDLAETEARRHMYILALLLSFSGRYNFRRLESMTHAIWCMILEDLIAPKIFMNVLCIPQLTITSDASVDSLPPDLSLSSDVPKDDRTERIPDFTGVFLAAKKRPRPFPLTFRSSNRPVNFNPSLPSGFLPAPASGSHFSASPFSNIINWHALKLCAYVTLYHAELKRPPSRRCKTPESFRNALNSLMQKAIDSSQAQAQLIFQAEPKTKHTISIIASGEWWSFSISTRADEPGRPKFKDDPRFSTQSQPPKRRLPVRKPIPAFWDAQIPPNWEVLNPSAPEPDLLDPGTKKESITTTIFDSDEPSTSQLYDGGENTAPRLYDDGDSSILEEWTFASNVAESGDDDESGSEGVISDAEEGDISLELPPGVRKAADQTRTNSRRWLRLNATEEVNRRFEAPVVQHLGDAIPPDNVWSKFMLLGTPASNQRLYIIQEILKIEAIDLSNELSGIAIYPSTSPPDPGR